MDILPPKVKIGVSPSLNIRGVIAMTDIKKGEVVESAPAILYPVMQRTSIQETLLKSYYFLWDDEFDAIILGYGSLYNHSYSPNADFWRDYERGLFIFEAWSDIKCGEEITINYNGFPEVQDIIGAEYLS